VTRPLPVVVHELGVLVAVGMGLLVLHPEQLQGHRRPPQFAVDRGPVRHRPLALGREVAAGEQPPLQVGVVHVVGERPAQAGGSDPAQVVGHRRRGHPRRSGHLTPAQSLPLAEAEYLSYLAHGGSGSGHRHSPRTFVGPSERGCQPSSPHAAARSSPRWSETPNWVVGFSRSAWSDSAELGGRIRRTPQRGARSPRGRSCPSLVTVELSASGMVSLSTSRASNGAT
jgi:hypothetical protein